MKSVVSLYDYQSHQQKNDEELLNFLIFRGRKSVHLYRFSPHLCFLGDDIYVADLQSVKSYWKYRAQQAGQSVREWVQEVATGLDSESEESCYIFCQHPFQGLLFFYYLQQRQSGNQPGGCFFMDTLFSDRSYRNIHWNDWLFSVRKMAEWCDSHRWLVAERKTFSSQVARFERFLQRMGLESLADFESVQFSEVQRRFQKFLALAWRWTFCYREPQKEEPAQQSFLLFQQQEKKHLLEFPWEPFRLFEVPKKETWLEFPLSTWDQITADLSQDLMLLSRQQPLQPPFQVMGFEWSIILYDGDTCCASIEFNYPVCLSQDREQDFQVCLKQFSFSFLQLKNQLEEKAKELDYMNAPFVLGWTVQVPRIVYHQNVNASLFAEVQQETKKTEALIELQNKIKSPLKSYSVHPSHVPSWDSVERPLDQPETDLPEGDDDFFRSLALLGKPLFLFHHPLGMMGEDIKHKYFLERTSSDWWQSQNSKDQCRDYYICQLKTGDIVWAFKDFQNKWFKHGLYS